MSEAKSKYYYISSLPKQNAYVWAPGMEDYPEDLVHGWTWPLKDTMRQLTKVRNAPRFSSDGEIPVLNFAEIDSLDQIQTLVNSEDTRRVLSEIYGEGVVMATALKGYFTSKEMFWNAGLTSEFLPHPEGHDGNPSHKIVDCKIEGGPLTTHEGFLTFSPATLMVFPAARIPNMFDAFADHRQFMEYAMTGAPLPEPSERPELRRFGGYALTSGGVRLPSHYGAFHYQVHTTEGPVVNLPLNTAFVECPLTWKSLGACISCGEELEPQATERSITVQKGDVEITLPVRTNPSCGTRLLNDVLGVEIPGVEFQPEQWLGGNIHDPNSQKHGTYARGRNLRRAPYIEFRGVADYLGVTRYGYSRFDLRFDPGFKDSGKKFYTVASEHAQKDWPAEILGYERARRSWTCSSNSRDRGEYQSHTVRNTGISSNSIRRRKEVKAEITAKRFETLAFKKDNCNSCGLREYCQTGLGRGNGVTMDLRDHGCTGKVSTREFYESFMVNVTQRRRKSEEAAATVSNLMDSAQLTLLSILSNARVGIFGKFPGNVVRSTRESTMRLRFDQLDIAKNTQTLTRKDEHGDVYYPIQFLTFSYCEVIPGRLYLNRKLPGASTIGVKVCPSKADMYEIVSHNLTGLSGIYEAQKGITPWSPTDEIMIRNLLYLMYSSHSTRFLESSHSFGRLDTHVSMHNDWISFNVSKAIHKTGTSLDYVYISIENLSDGYKHKHVRTEIRGNGMTVALSHLGKVMAKNDE